jgi:hypothetical protein
MPLLRLSKTIPYRWKIIAPAFCVVLFTFLFCSCDDGDANKAKVVFVGGYTGPQGKEVATYWKNEEEVRLGDGTNPSAVNTIFVANNNVYAGGYEIIIDSISNGRYFTPTIWKNGAKIKLAASPLARSSRISSIYVSGHDVHATGSVGDENSGVYWKNGEIVQSQYRVAYNGVLVYKGDVYIVGTLDGYATYWKNGTAVQLSDKWSSAKSISVDEDVIYVLGTISGHLVEPDQNIYWRNGEEVQLGTTADKTGVYEIQATHGDVYICGTQSITLDGKTMGVACYWKNGTRVDLTDGAAFSYATGISVIDNEVFASISEDPLPSGNVPTAWYYSGQTAVRLADLNLRSRVYSIFVVK